MTITERLRHDRANHWIFCVGAAIIGALSFTGGFFTLAVNPPAGCLANLLAVACVAISRAQYREARRHGRLIRVEESRKRITRI
jgi:hypothetical protein